MAGNKTKEGFLFSEFDQIFQDIFSRRAPSYKRIVSANEVQEKIEQLKLPKGYTVRPVLIYSGVLTSGIEEDGYFDTTLDFDQLLTTSLE